MAVRAVLTTNGLYLRTVRLSGDGGYDPGFIAQTKETASSNAMPQAVSRLIDRTLWNDSYRPQSSDGVDGEEWIVEGMKDGRYRVITMWSPPPVEFASDGPAKLFVQLCEALIGLSGETMEKAVHVDREMKLRFDPLRQRHLMNR